MNPTEKQWTDEEIEKFKDRRKNLSEALKGRKAWNKGIKWSEEVKRKISESRKGIPAWNKGKKGVMPTPWNKGLKWPEESKL